MRQLDQRKRRVRLCRLLQFPRRFGRREVFLRRQNSFRIKRIYNLEGDGRRFEQPPGFPDHRNRVRGRRRLPFEAGQLESGRRDDRNLLLRRHFPREATMRIAVLQSLQVVFELWLSGSGQNRALGSLPLEFWIKGPLGRRRVKRRTHLERGSVLTYHQISSEPSRYAGTKADLFEGRYRHIVLVTNQVRCRMIRAMSIGMSESRSTIFS